MPVIIGANNNVWNIYLVGLPFPPTNFKRNRIDKQ